MFYTPAGIYVYIHDGVTGLTKCGKSTVLIGEKRVIIRGPRHISEWHCSWDHIRKKNFGVLLLQCDFYLIENRREIIY